MVSAMTKSVAMAPIMASRATPSSARTTLPSQA